MNVMNMGIVSAFHTKARPSRRACKCIVRMGWDQRLLAVNQLLFHTGTHTGLQLSDANPPKKNKKLLGTSASLLVTSALLVVTMFAINVI